MVSQHQYPLPGHPTLVRNVATLLAQGVEIDLVCVTSRLCAGLRLPDRPGLRLYGLPMKPLQAASGAGASRFPALWYPFKFFAFFLWAVFVVSALAARRRYDVVQVDTIPDLLVFSTVVPRLRGTPVVLYVYDLMPEMAAIRLGLGPDDLRVRLITWIEQAATAWADRVITVTDLFRRRMVGRGLDSGKVTIVANSHPLADLPPRVPTRPPVVVLPASLIRRYGAHVAIGAMAELRASWPDLTLHILGQGEYLPALIELTTRLGLQDRIRFSPFLPWRQAMEHVRTAAVGVVPIIADGYGELILPNKVFEFVFLEVPFACSRLGGIEEHLPPDAVSYFEPGDVRGCAAQLHRLLADPVAARHQARRAKQAMADLGWEHMSGQYLRALGVGPERVALVAQRLDQLPAEQRPALQPEP
jgi:glycosyltransferase involved in cell wall biosynthesis